MTSWGELVTTALLGTARRGVPGDKDPAATLLDLAATHRTAAMAGRRPEPASAPCPPAVPPLPAAPAAADLVLTGLLDRPDPILVNLWLAAGAERGYGAAPEHWTRLASLAARSTAYDRSRLLAVLGPAGRWFLEQNAAWRRLTQGSQAVPSAPHSPTRPPPTPPDVVASALEIIGGTSLGAARPAGERRAYAARLGAEMALAAYPMIAPAAERSLYQRPAPLTERRLARECFVVCEGIAWTRISIRDGFDPPDAPTPRREIPPLTP